MAFVFTILGLILNSRFFDSVFHIYSLFSTAVDLQTSSMLLFWNHKIRLPIWLKRDSGNLLVDASCCNYFNRGIPRVLEWNNGFQKVNWRDDPCFILQNFVQARREREREKGKIVRGISSTSFVLGYKFVCAYSIIEISRTLFQWKVRLFFLLREHYTLFFKIYSKLSTSINFI